MQSWVIYKDWKFHPAPFLARNVDQDGNYLGREIPGESLEDVRGKLPPGFHLIHSTTQEDPLVMEIWERLD